MGAVATLGAVALPGIALIEELGRGGSAVVYRARHDDDEVAVKLFESSEPQVLQRFRREVALLGRIRGAGIPRLYQAGSAGEAGCEGGHPFVVTELVRGPSLAERVSEGPLGTRAIVDVAIDVARALDAVHRAGFVHRDVKPGNIIVADDGASYLIDFDLGTPIGMRDEMTVGTLAYSAPEQLGVLDRPVDERSDLYSLGAVLFEMSTGRAPFEGSASSIIAGHASTPVTPLTRLRPQIDSALDLIVRTLLAKDPNDRYQSAQALLADLERRWTVLERSAGELRFAPRLGTRVEREPTPLAGRERELRKLELRWSEVREQVGCVVALRGPEGSGRTRLGAELAKTVHSSGGTVLHLRASPGMRPLEGLRRAIEGWLDEAGPHQDWAAVREALGDYAPMLVALVPRLGGLLEVEEGQTDAPEEAAFLDGVARFLGVLAERSAGALLRCDDVQWLDDATCRVLKRIFVGLERRPMMVLMSAWPLERDPPEGLRALASAQGAGLEQIELERLEDREVEHLISSLIGADEMESESLARLVRQSQGSPLATELLVRAVLERGLALPSWGTWSLDLEAFDRLELPEDLSNLLAVEVEQIEPSIRRILQAAALWGFDGDQEFPRALFGIEEVDAAFAEGIGRGILVPRGEMSVEFVHRHAQEVLAASLEPRERAELHHAFAEALEQTEDPDPFALAHHRAAGSRSRDPAAVVRSNIAAGHKAHESFAYAEAHRYLEVARSVAEAHELEFDARSRRMLGEACQFIGDMTGAVGHLEACLAGTLDPIERAQLRGRLAEVYLAHVELEQAWSEILRGYEELGQPFASSKFALASRSTLRWSAGLVMHRTRLGYGTANPERRRKLEAVTLLGELAQGVAYLREWTFELIQLSLGQIYDAQRIGPSSELVRAFAAYALGMAAIGWRRSAEHFIAEGYAVAEAIGDRQMEGRCRFYEGMAYNVMGEVVEACRIHRRNLEEFERWLDPSDYIRACGDLGWILGLRGYAQDAVRWLQNGRERAATIEVRDDVRDDHHYVAYLMAHLPVVGRPVEAQQCLQRFRMAARESGESWRIHLSHGYEIAYCYEMGELGAPLERALEEHDALGVDPKRAQFHRKNFYVYKAYAQIA